MALIDDARELNRDVEMAASAHQALLANLDRMLDTGTFDVTGSSRLPGWTRGHVLAHLINSGDGHAGIFEGAMLGEVRAQYPHGAEGRAADIEADSTRSATELRDALRTSIWKLEGCWAGSNWQGSGISPRGGELSITELPFYRMREVAIHHIDLDIGDEFADLPDRYMRLELRRMEMLWAARQPMGLATLPDLALVLEPPQRLAWLMGRVSVDGLDPAAVF